MTIMIVGVGDAGAKVLSVIAAEEVNGVRLVSLNTHLQPSPDYDTLLIGETGLGGGGDPAYGRRAFEYSADEVHALLQPVKKLLIVCGLGGGTGTGAAPALARYATALEIETIGIVSLPFTFEGSQRQIIAAQNLPHMQQHTRETAVIDSNSLINTLKLPKRFSLQEGFNLLDRFMAWHTLTRLV